MVSTNNTKILIREVPDYILGPCLVSWLISFIYILRLTNQREQWFTFCSVISFSLSLGLLPPAQLFIDCEEQLTSLILLLTGLATLRLLSPSKRYQRTAASINGLAYKQANVRIGGWIDKSTGMWTTYEWMTECYWRHQALKVIFPSYNAMRCAVE